MGVGQGLVLFQALLEGVLLGGGQVAVGKAFEGVEVLAQAGGRATPVRMQWPNASMAS